MKPKFVLTLILSLFIVSTISVSCRDDDTNDDNRPQPSDTTNNSNDSTTTSNDSINNPNDSINTPNDTINTPNDTTIISNDTTIISNDTINLPQDTTSISKDTADIVINLFSYTNFYIGKYGMFNINANSKLLTIKFSINEDCISEGTAILVNFNDQTVDTIKESEYKYSKELKLETEYHFQIDAVKLQKDGSIQSKEKLIADKFKTGNV